MYSGSNKTQNKRSAHFPHISFTVLKSNVSSHISHASLLQLLFPTSVPPTMLAATMYSSVCVRNNVAEIK